MTGLSVADALATLRTAISGYSGTPLRWPDRRDALDALACVENEIARLEGLLTDTRTGERGWQARAEAAEAEVAHWKASAEAYRITMGEYRAEVARLKDGLRPFAATCCVHAARGNDALRRLEEQRDGCAYCRARALLAEEKP